MNIENEEYYENFLNIKTKADENDNENKNVINYGYNPTTYIFLNYIFKKYPFHEDDHLIDFGCGYGRVMIMASHYSCKNIKGYEIDEKRYKLLIENISKYKQKHPNNSNFCTYSNNASSSLIDIKDNKFFFFEPFHLKIYIKIIKKIVNSLNEKYRETYLMLFCPSEVVVNYIDTITIYKKIEYELFAKNSYKYVICKS